MSFCATVERDVDLSTLPQKVAREIALRWKGGSYRIHVVEQEGIIVTGDPEFYTLTNTIMEFNRLREIKLQNQKGKKVIK